MDYEFKANPNGGLAISRLDMEIQALDLIKPDGIDAPAKQETGRAAETQITEPISRNNNAEPPYSTRKIDEFVDQREALRSPLLEANTPAEDELPDEEPRERPVELPASGVRDVTNEDVSQPSRHNTVTPSRLSKLPDEYSISDLMQYEPEETRWIVNDLVSEGLILLAGRPKQGKSWLCLDIAMAVATGSKAMTEHEVDHGDVLMVSLEDGGRRLRRRLHDMGFDASESASLTLRERMSPDDEILDIINRWAERSANPKLVVIDTWVHVRPKQSGKDAYKQDYEALSNLRKIALEHNLATLVVMHLRKQEAVDAFDEISGSVGISAAADMMLVLRKTRAGQSVELLGRGRDIEDFGRKVAFDNEICRWRVTGQVDPHADEPSGNRRGSVVQDRILSFLNAQTDSFMPAEIAKAIGENPGTVRQNLKRLADRAQLERNYNGSYSVSTNDSEHPL